MMQHWDYAEQGLGSKSRYNIVYMAQPCNPSLHGHGPVFTLSDIVDILLAYK